MLGFFLAVCFLECIAGLRMLRTLDRGEVLLHLIHTNATDYTALMLWIKALHIVFVASWFAGLFYLPRIFVNLAMVPADSHAERARLLLMGRKLLRFTTILAVPALVFGVWMWLGYGLSRKHIRKVSRPPK